MQPDEPQYSTNPQPVAPVNEVPSNDESYSAPDSGEAVRWQATEYVHREKDQIWFVVFGLITLTLMAAAVFMKAWSFAILIPVMAASLLIYARRPPRVMNYVLTGKGLYVNDYLFPYGDFKSFALTRTAEQYSIMLVPVKRFKPGLTVSFPAEAGEAIVDTLAARLPMEEAEPDLVDRLIHKLHL